MKKAWTRLIVLAALWCGVMLPAHAAVTCNVSAVDNYIVSYDALATADQLGTGTFTVTCTRTASGDPTSVSFSAATNNGQNPSGATNRAKLGTGFIKYDFFTNSGYSTNWSTQSSKSIGGTVNIGSSVPSTGSAVATYYSKLAFGQTSPQGVYTDTVAINMTYGTANTAAPSVNLAVQITNVPSCKFSTPPGTISFTYTAFSTSAKTATTSFSALCSTSLAYTMSLNAASGVVSGLHYSLALSSASGTGTGAAQSYTITGTMDAGQAGTCTGSTCTASQPHTLTIAY